MATWKPTMGATTKLLYCYWNLSSFRQSRPLLHSRPSQLTNFVSHAECPSPPCTSPIDFLILELAFISSARQPHQAYKRTITASSKQAPVSPRRIDSFTSPPSQIEHPYLVRRSSTTRSRNPSQYFIHWPVHTCEFPFGT